MTENREKENRRPATPAKQPDVSAADIVQEPDALIQEPSTLMQEPFTSTQPRLTVTHLSKTYVPLRRGVLRGGPAPVQALDDVSFALTPGLYGLPGPNGAGKSTLINIITGSLMPTAGQVCWCGQNTRAPGIRFRRVLGYMPQ